MTLRELYKKYLEEDIEYIELVYRTFLFFSEIRDNKDQMFFSERTNHFLDLLHDGYVNGLSSIQVRRMVKIYINETEIPRRLRD